jgi:hypothetical protein
MTELVPSLSDASFAQRMGSRPAPQRQEVAPPRPAVVLVPVLIVFYAFLLLPPETEFSLFGVRFYGYRLGVLFGTVPALWMTIRNARGFFNWIDIGVVLMSFWIVLSFMAHYGLELGLLRGIGIVIDTALSYFVARASIATPNDLRRFLILILPGITLVGILMAIESLSGRLLVRPFATSIFGNMSRYYGGEAVGILELKVESRAGLLRAWGPFDHPILGGTIMTGLLPLYWYSGLTRWVVALGVGAALCGLFSLSSAAFLGVFLMFVAIATDRILPYIPKLTWWTILTIAGTLLLALQLIAANGIITVLARLTFDPQTAYYRLLIWQYGSQNVTDNPLFGVGYAQWERPSWMGESIDAHFLALAVTYGIMVPILLLAGVVFGMTRVGQIMSRLDPQSRQFLFGLNTAVFVYLIIGQTVTYFSAGLVTFMSMLGFLASLASWAEYRARTDRQMALMRARAMMYEAMAMPARAV